VAAAPGLGCGHEGTATLTVVDVYPITVQSLPSQSTPLHAAPESGRFAPTDALSTKSPGPKSQVRDHRFAEERKVIHWPAGVIREDVRHKE